METQTGGIQDQGLKGLEKLYYNLIKEIVSLILVSQLYFL